MAERDRPDAYTPGRFALASTDARGARDPIALTSQVKFMREGLEQALGKRPAALMLIVVDQEELVEAQRRVTAALEPTPPRDGAFTCSIRGCARCGGDGHQDVIWQPLTFPIEDVDGTLWTHWAPCPTNGEPILMMRREAADAG